MKVLFYDPTREYTAHKAEFDRAVGEVMSKGDFILGSDVAAFEKECAEYLGVPYAVGVASGSDALIIGSDILGYRDGAEVLTPVFTFFASASCVVRLGAKPIFVDLDENTLNMDLNSAAEKLTGKTKGIIPVHLFYQPTPMQEVMDLARSAGLSVLEDAAEAWGMESLVDGAWKKAGAIGTIGAYSFFPTKTLGAFGDAGLMVTNDESLYRKMKSYRVHGASVKYHHDYIGYNSRLDTIQAAVLRVKVKRTGESIASRARHAAHYRARLEERPEITIPGFRSNAKPVDYVFNIIVPDRDGLAARLAEKTIGYSIYYPIPLHLQKCFEYLGHKEGDYPVAERISKGIIALPMYPELTDDEVDYICDEVNAFYRS